MDRWTHKIWWGHCLKPFSEKDVIHECHSEARSAWPGRPEASDVRLRCFLLTLLTFRPRSADLRTWKFPHQVQVFPFFSKLPSVENSPEIAGMLGCHGATSLSIGDFYITESGSLVKHFCTQGVDDATEVLRRKIETRPAGIQQTAHFWHYSGTPNRFRLPFWCIFRCSEHHHRVTMWQPSRQTRSAGWWLDIRRDA